MTPLRAVTYARVSDREKAKHGYSLSEQKEQCEAYCRLRGYALVCHIEDGGISGELSDRPGLNRLQEMVRAGTLDVIVCLNISRLSRIHWEGAKLTEEIRSAGVQVEWVQHGGGGDPEGELQEGIHGSFARYQLRELQRKTTEARVRKAQGSEGRPPRWPIELKLLGYDYTYKWEAKANPALQAGEIRINEEEAALVRIIFRQYLALGGTRALAKWLTESGYRTKTGGTNWYTTTVKDILSQRAYTGRIAYGKKEWQATRKRTAGGRRQVKGKPRDPSEWIWVPCPSIVDEDLFNRVQEQLECQALTIISGRPSTYWLLRGLVFCSECRAETGRPLFCTGVTRQEPKKDPGRYDVYLCNSVHKRQGRTYCGARILKRRVEAAVKDALWLAIQPGVLEADAKAFAEAQRAALTGSGEHVTRLERELGECEAKARNLVRLAASGVAADLITAELSSLDSRRRTLRQELGNLTARLEALDDPGTAAKRAREVAAAICERWETLYLPENAGLLQALYQQVVRVTLQPGGEFHVAIRSRETVLPWEGPDSVVSWG